MLARIELLQQYLKEDPSDCFSRYALALEYIKLERDELASPLMEFLYEQQPEYLPNYYHFGKLLERSNQLEKAIMVYNRGIRLARESKEMHTLNELTSALDSISDL